MRQCRVYMVSWLVILCTVALTGQGCPSVGAARDSILAAEGGGENIIEAIRANCPGAPDSLSGVYHKLSVAGYLAGDWEAAIGWAERALAVQRKLYADGPEEPLGKTLANLGLFYRNTGAHTRALPYLREAERVFTEIGNWRRRHNNREQMVYTWHTTGDLGRAGALLPEMLADARAEPPGYYRTLAEAETLRLLGVQATEAEDYAAALPYFTEAAPLFAEIGEVMSQIGTDMDIARALYHGKDYAAAAAKANEVLAFIAPYELPYEKAVLYNLLVLTHTDQGDFALADRKLEPGLEQARLSGNPRVMALLYNAEAELARARGTYAEAREANARALGALTRGWTYSEETPLPPAAGIAASEYRKDIFLYLVFLAETLAEGGAAAGAMEAIEAGDVTADLLRSDFSGEISKLFWRKEALPLYELGVRLANAAGNEEAMFYYLEKSRSVLLLEALLEADLLDELDPELAAALHALESRPAGGGGLARTDSIIALRQEIADRNPAGRALIERPEMVSLERARANLERGGWDRQLHFFTGAERTYAFSLTQDAATTVDLGPSTELAPALRALLNFFTGPAPIDQDPAGFLAASHAVYRKVLEPLGITPGEKLLILPDGLFAYLPFGALVTEAGAATVGSAPYLIRRNPVSYAQSATILDRQAGYAAEPDGGSLAFAPFVVALPGNAAPPLTYSKREVEGLEDHYPAQILSGTAADRAALLSQAGEQRLLHLSTHAYATASAAERPRILTADAPVYPADVYGLNLNADLVTLSACQSNIGPLAAGEGVLGLGRAFTAAGARGVVASLWSLNDRATADIVTTFYDELANGTGKPAALHAAQLAYLERKDLPGYLKSPYYWAGLTYYGDGGGVATGRWPWLALLLGGGIVVLGVVVFWVLRRRGA